MESESGIAKEAKTKQCVQDGLPDKNKTGELVDKNILLVIKDKRLLLAIREKKYY